MNSKLTMRYDIVKAWVWFFAVPTALVFLALVLIHHPHDKMVNCLIAAVSIFGCVAGMATSFIRLTNDDPRLAARALEAFAEGFGL